MLPILNSDGVIFQPTTQPTKCDVSRSCPSHSSSLSLHLCLKVGPTWGQNRAALNPLRLQDCANFCAHPTDRWAQLRTASHMLQTLLSCCFSAATLKTGGLFRIARLPWAQEVPSSNLGAPTTYSFIFNELFQILQRWKPDGVNP